MIRLPRSVAVLIALAMVSSQPAGAGHRSLRMEEPRSFGYFVGDAIERRADLLVDADDTLLAASLPSPGPITYWLDLLRVDVEESRAEGGRVYRIILVYQNFYVPLDPRKLTIPEWPLRLANGTAVIPAFTFTASPIRELFPEKSGETVATFLQPDARPPSISAGWWPSGLGMSAATALLALALLARHHAWWPFRRRHDRPFTRASRAIARLQGDGIEAPGYREAFLTLHRAFDATARRRVLAADIEGFIVHHPEFAVVRAAVGEFFHSSWYLFYGRGDKAPALMPLRDVKALAGELARSERRQ